MKPKIRIHLLSLFCGLFLLACGGGGGGDAQPTAVTPPTQPPSAANQPPTANAGPDQSVNEGVQVNLSGSGSDTDGSITSYSWQQIGGTAVAISGGSTTNPSFTAPMVSSSEVLEFRLEVVDDDGAVGSDTVEVTVNDISQGTTTDVNAFLASIDRRFLDETAALESEQNTAQAQASASGTYLSGGYLGGARDRFISHLNSFFSFFYDEAIRLTENGTFFPYDFILAERDWQRDQWQSYLDQFLASSLFNGHSSFDLDDIIRQDVLTAINDVINNTFNRLDASGRIADPPTPANQAPIANAGVDQSVDEGTTVYLSGVGSDSDGFISSYSWTQDSGVGVAITDADMAYASFVAPMVESEQELVFRFVVADDDGATGSDTVRITVNDEPDPNGNQPPTADAGMDQIVDEGTTVNLIGLGVDSDGTVVSYNWQQVSGPTTTISDANMANASFVAPEVTASEDLVFRLTVTDNEGATGSDTVTITVRDIPPPPVLEWSIVLNEPTGVVGTTRAVLITGTLTNSSTSNMNLGVIGGTEGDPPGFDYEVAGVASSASGYTYSWLPNGPDSFIKQFEGVNLAPGASFDFEFARLSPDASVSPGITYTVSLELQLFDAPRSSPMIGSSVASVNWTVENFGLVFVTSQTFDGDFGGIQGAHNQCNNSAVAAGLAGTYVAWISDSTTNAKDRVTDQGYITIAGDIIATSLEDLIDGAIGVPLDVDENGISFPFPGSGNEFAVWTNTTPGGPAGPGGVNFEPYVSGERNACKDWSSTGGSAAYGRLMEPGVGWSGAGDIKFCDRQARLYCFEQ
jgi:hypothetical protein